MPIKKNGQGQIVYTEPDEKFKETGVGFDTEFGIADRLNELKQIQFEVNPLTPGPGVATIQVDIDGDETINLSSLGTKSNSFAVIQPDLGTSPTALVYNDTLIETSSDSSVVITGNSGTNTLNFNVAASIQSGASTANSGTSVNIANTLVKRDGSGNFNAGTITASLTGAASLNVLKSGDTMSGSLTLPSAGLILKDTGSNTITLQAPISVTSSYALKLPISQGAVGSILTDDGFGNLSWQPTGSNIDGGKATSVYTPTQFINGGSA